MAFSSNCILDKQFCNFYSGDPLGSARVIREYLKQERERCLQEAQHSLRTFSGPKLALVFDRKCLMYALDPGLQGNLLNLNLNSNSVVYCRVYPRKAQVTTLVKKGARKITHYR